MNMEGEEKLANRLKAEIASLKKLLREKEKRIIGLEKQLSVKNNSRLMERNNLDEPRGKMDSSVVIKSNDEEILLLRTLINHLPSSIFVLDKSFRKTICNEAHLRRIESTLKISKELSYEDIIGKTNQEVYPRDISDQYFEEDRKVLEEGFSVYERLNYQIDPDGNPIWETITKIPMRDKNGVIIGLLGIAHNITKTKLAEIAIQESEERYRYLFERNPVPMLIYEKNSFAIRAVNEAFQNHYGYSTEVIFSMTFMDLHIKEERLRLNEFAKNLEGYKSSTEWHHIKSNGERITVVTCSNDIIFENKKCRVVVIIDISDSKLTEGRLRASEEKFRLISNSAHDGIFMLNDENRFIYWNPAVEKILNCSGEDLALIDINTFFVPSVDAGKNIFTANVLELKDNDGISGLSIEPEMLRADGIVIKTELSLAPILVSDHWGAVGIVRDITERKIVESELVNAKVRAEESDRLKSAFLATMSHELRTPLNAIIGFSSLIEDTMEVPEIMEMVKIINESGNHLLGIIDSVFSLALLQAGVSKVQKEDIQLNNYILGLKPYLITKLGKEKKEHFKVLINTDSNDPSLVIRTDKTKLTQMMVNFLDNAIKYTFEGSIEYGYKTEGKSVIFFVKDTGIGIPKDKQSVVFERFRQLEDSLTREYGGVGLGLAICKEIAELLEGHIWVDSIKGEGSTFYFRLNDVIV